MPAPKEDQGASNQPPAWRKEVYRQAHGAVWRIPRSLSQRLEGLDHRPELGLYLREKLPQYSLLVRATLLHSGNPNVRYPKQGETMVSRQTWRGLLKAYCWSTVQRVLRGCRESVLYREIPLPLVLPFFSGCPGALPLVLFAHSSNSALGALSLILILCTCLTCKDNRNAPLPFSMV